MKDFLKLIVLSVFCLLFASNSSAATLFHVDDFESGTTEGWAGASPTNQSSGGPLGADDNFLQLVSTGTIGPGSKMAARNETSDWTGDYAVAGVEIISVDMMVPDTSPSLEMRLVLIEPTGPTSTNNRWTSTVSQAVPNDGVWRNYSFAVAEEDLTFVPLFSATSDYNTLITNVFRVLLRHDSGDPDPEGTEIAATLGIDNATLTTLGTPGDFDMDGDVDGIDFLGWQRGESPSPLSQTDFHDWEMNFGTVNPLLANAVTAPEPASAILVMGLFQILFFRVRNS